jgi:ATP-dependent Clp protease ATP-binding subunit ClpA
MFSQGIQATLEREVVGQADAIHNVVQGVTRLASGLMPRERKWCAYMFLGPSGTGKTQLIQTLGKALHGEGGGLYVADCTHYAHHDAWFSFVSQLLPMFHVPEVHENALVLGARPLSIVLVEYLERGRKELSKALAAALETGRIPLPGGRQGSLNGCLVFLTTTLCSREILEEGPRIGFQAVADAEIEGERERIYRLCHAQAVEQFGDDLLGRLDALVVFHRLQQDHLVHILERRFARMARWLEQWGIHCELSEAARAFLVARGGLDLKFGARDFVRAHRRFVEFPLADLLVSGGLPPGSAVVVDRLHDEGQLHLTVSRQPAAASSPRETPVPIHWEPAGQRA